MPKTAKEVQSAVIALLKDSKLASSVSGGIYRRGYRPHDSQLEDIIVIYTTGFPAEIESGVITINIYVPDIALQADYYVENGQRTAEIERAAADWFSSLTVASSEYRFRLRQTIYTIAEPAIRQHFVVLSLGYERYAGND